MTDKELLELAAKAAGQERSAAGDLWSNARGQLWNPLTDDGDALRLAVKLEFVLVADSEGAAASWMRNRKYGGGVDEKSKGDPCAAMRRAIVRAAAEIGKDMA